MKEQHILVVDDEKNITRVLQAYLEREGFKVTAAHDGEAALRLARAEQPDLVILDLMLPGLSGEAVCRQLRSEDSRVPVIMLTAKSGLEDKLYGLGLGADDYVVKPFSPREVVARARTILRRAAEDRGPLTDILSLVGGKLQIKTLNRRVDWCGRILELTPTEFNLLAHMARHPGRVFSRARLCDAAFDFACESYERTIDAHIKNLRRKLQQAGAPAIIKTVYGVGYKVEEN